MYFVILNRGGVMRGGVIEVVDCIFDVDIGRVLSHSRDSGSMAEGGLLDFNVSFRLVDQRGQCLGVLKSKLEVTGICRVEYNSPGHMTWGSKRNDSVKSTSESSCSSGERSRTEAESTC